jgi:probable phosphoglycerate mutase
VILYFARHGESEANVKGIFANAGEGYGLTDRGKLQVAALAEELRGEQIDAVYASPLSRAQQTAEIVCASLGLTFQTRAALTEFSVGDMEGTAQPDGRKEINWIESECMVQGHPEARLGGGECLEDIHARFLSLITEITSNSDPDARILLIGHGGLFACSLPAILSNVDNRFALNHPIKPTGLIIAEKIDDKFYCLRWTDTIFPKLSETSDLSAVTG